MSEAKTEMELTGLERFSHLEDKIFRVVEAFKAVRKENDSLKAEAQQLRGELEALRRKQSSYTDELGQLQREREELRERVEKTLTLLASLEVK